MDNIVTISYTDNLDDLDKQLGAFQSLTYREKKLSDMKQMELTGMYNTDYYNLLRSLILSKSQVDEKDPRDPSLNINESVDTYLMKTKMYKKIIEKEIYRTEKNIEAIKDNKKIAPYKIYKRIKYKDDTKFIMYSYKDYLSYLKAIYGILKNENCSIDREYLVLSDTILDLHVDKQDKLDTIDILISELKSTIKDYDIAISYVNSNKIEDAVKTINKITLDKIVSSLLGPTNIIISYIAKRFHTASSYKLRSKTLPKKYLEEERDKLSNTLKILEGKKKIIEKEY